MCLPVQSYRVLEFFFFFFSRLFSLLDVEMLGDLFGGGWSLMLDVHVVAAGCRRKSEARRRRRWHVAPASKASPNTWSLGLVHFEAPKKCSEHE